MPNLAELLVLLAAITHLLKPNAFLKTFIFNSLSLVIFKYTLN